jgi:hypothetical protein
MAKRSQAMARTSTEKFKTIPQSELPDGRRGKHHEILSQVLADLEELEAGRALKIPLADFSGSVADLRSAILRGTSKRKIKVASSSDDEFLYVWKPAKDGATKSS